MAGLWHWLCHTKTLVSCQENKYKSSLVIHPNIISTLSYNMICIYTYIHIYIYTIYIYQIIHIVFPSNNANNAIKQWLTCDPPTPPAAEVTPACNSPVPQFGGLWQPRFTMPEAPLMKELSPVFMPLSTHFFLRWQWLQWLFIGFLELERRYTYVDVNFVYKYIIKYSYANMGDSTGHSSW